MFLQIYILAYLFTILHLIGLRNSLIFKSMFALKSVRNKMDVYTSFEVGQSSLKWCHICRYTICKQIHTHVYTYVCICNSGQTSVLEFLLKQDSIIVNAVDRFGGTPYDDAIRHDNRGAAALLEQAGCLGTGHPDLERVSAQIKADRIIAEKKTCEPKILHILQNRYIHTHKYTQRYTHMYTYVYVYVKIYI